MWIAKTLQLMAASAVLAVPICCQETELRSVANSLSEDIASSGKRTLAVVDFTDLQGNPTELGRFLAEEFAVALTRTRRGFEVIDRNHLTTLLKEHKLAATGLIDPSTARKLGQIAGVDLIVTGSMTPFGDSVRVAVKVLAVDTARMVAANTVDLPKTKTIEELLGSPSAGTRGDVVHPSRPTPAGGLRPQKTGSQSATGSEFVFELVECRAVGSSVRCSLRVTNRGEDRKLQFRSGDAYDDAGNRTEGRDSLLGNERSRMLLMISGVPVSGNLLFEGISGSAGSLALLDIWCVEARPRGPGRLDFNIQFRNVRLVR